jgi:hypothetical protein
MPPQHSSLEYMRKLIAWRFAKSKRFQKLFFLKPALNLTCYRQVISAAILIHPESVINVVYDPAFSQKWLLTHGKLPQVTAQKLSDARQSGVSEDGLISDLHPIERTKFDSANRHHPHLTGERWTLFCTKSTYQIH